MGVQGLAGTGLIFTRSQKGSGGGAGWEQVIRISGVRWASGGESSSVHFAVSFAYSYQYCYCYCSLPLLCC